MAILRPSRLRGFSPRLAGAAVLVSGILASPIAAAAVRAQEGAPSAPPPTPVRVAVAREESLAPRRKVFGELRPSRRVIVASEESGLVRELLVREGDLVERGAVLALLDSTRVELELAANAASLRAAEALAQERAAAAERERRDLALIQRAAEAGGTNPRELADAESALAIAEVQVVAARAAAGIVEEQGKLLAERLRDAEVRAPFVGVVTRKATETGAWIAAGGAVVELVDAVGLEGWFDVPQELLESAQKLVAGAGGLGAIEIRTANGGVLRAERVRIVPEIDPRSRTFHAVVDARNDGTLAAGLALHAFVPQGAPSAFTVVPKDALLYQGTNTSVLVVDRGVARPVPVRVAFPVGDSVALEPGSVAAGATVVVEGNERLMPGSPVAPIASPASASAEAAK
jgi:RND family efflux transporter MFP subunit